tara:strand:+ start:262 stop:1206 length:945 start_codon:yes stop_codon:yes gene_type:complete
MTTIYILRLTNNKYYIGKTNNPQKRILNHFQRQGSTWTKKYKPVRIEKIINNADEFDEDKWTIKYMKLYGIGNVRGGSFCSIQLSKANKQTLQLMITGSSECCYKCGQRGHYISQCPGAQNTKFPCSQCGRTFDTKRGAAYHKRFYCKKKTTQNTKFPCSQCGKTFDTKKGAAYHKRFYCKKNPAEIRHTSSSYNAWASGKFGTAPFKSTPVAILPGTRAALRGRERTGYRMYDTTMAMKEKHRVVVGSRVRMIGGCVGKVAFIGPVHYARGEFVGIVLDLRLGKNNGYLAGVRYFECDLDHGMMARRAELTVI